MIAAVGLEAIVLEALKLANRILDFEVARFEALDADGKREAAQAHQDGLNRLNDGLNRIHALVMQLFVPAPTD